MRGLAIAAVLTGALAALGTWRYVAMAAELNAVRGELAEHLRAPPTSTAGDASGRVASVVEADERLFDHAVRLASAQHLLGWAVMSAWALMAVMATLLVRSRIRNPEER